VTESNTKDFYIETAPARSMSYMRMCGQLPIVILIQMCRGPLLAEFGPHRDKASVWAPRVIPEVGAAQRYN
jgi:hypothetical protein